MQHYNNFILTTDFDCTNARLNINWRMNYFRPEAGLVLALLAWGASSSPPLRLTAALREDLLTLWNMSMDDKLMPEKGLTLRLLVRLLPYLSPSPFLICVHYHIVFRGFTNNMINQETHTVRSMMLKILPSASSINPMDCSMDCSISGYSIDSSWVSRA